MRSTIAIVLALSSHRSIHTALRSLIAVVLALLLGCGNGIGGYQRDVVDSFTPMSDDEARAIARMRQYLLDAQRLLVDQELSADQREAIFQAINDTRDALSRFVIKREQGSDRRESIRVIQGAAFAIVANDATGIGAADDFLLVGTAIAYVATLIMTRSPAPRDEVEAAWSRVGRELELLGTLIEATARRAASAARPVPQPRPPDITDLPCAAPANDNQPPGLEPGQPGQPGQPAKPPAGSIRGTPSPVPLPRPTQDADEDRDPCKPRPVPHQGGDPIHDMCADTVLGNVFPGQDVLVLGKRFDALDRNRVLYEVKTGDYSSYSEFLKQQTRKQIDKALKEDMPKALACKFRYQFAVADELLYKELITTIDLALIKYVPECKRRIKP